MPGYDVERDPRLLPGLLRPAGPPHRGEFAAGPGQRPDAAVHQRRDEPVQGRVPGPRAARLRARHQLAEVHAGQRQAQRPRERRAVAAPPHLLRDARQLLVRRLLQDRRRGLRVGTADEGLEPAARAPARDGVQGRRGGAPRRGGVRALARVPAGRPDQRARRRQLLGDGGHRAVRALLGSPLLPRQRPPLLRARLPGRRLLVRPLRRDLEQRVHGVQPAGGRHAEPAPGAVNRHRHGPRADHGRPAGGAVQLRHRPVHAAARDHRRHDRRPLHRVDVPHRRVDARRGRPRAGGHLPHRRRGGPVQRVARLRAAQDHAARHAPRQAPRHDRTVPAPPGGRARPRDGRRLPRPGPAARLRRPDDPRRGRALRIGADERPAEAGGGTRPGGRVVARAVGGRGVQAVRHVRRAAGLHRGHGGGAQGVARPRRVRAGHGGAAGEGPGRPWLRHDQGRGAGVRRGDRVAPGQGRHLRRLHGHARRGDSGPRRDRRRGPPPRGVDRGAGRLSRARADAVLHRVGRPGVGYRHDRGPGGPGKGGRPGARRRRQAPAAPRPRHARRHPRGGPDHRRRGRRGEGRDTAEPHGHSPAPRGAEAGPRNPTSSRPGRWWRRTGSDSTSFTSRR